MLTQDKLNRALNNWAQISHGQAGREISHIHIAKPAVRSGYDIKDDFHTLEGDIPTHGKAQGETIVLFLVEKHHTTTCFLFLLGVVEKEKDACAS